MHAQKKKQDSKDEAEEDRVKTEGSTYAMMALLPLKETKSMHRKRKKQDSKDKAEEERRAVLTP